MFIGQFRFVGLGSWKAGGGGDGEKSLLFSFPLHAASHSICLLSGFFLAEFFIFSVISRALTFGFIVTRKYIIP